MNPYEFQPWYPRGIKYFIAASASNYVALFDEDTVLKFPIVPPREDGLYSAEGQAYRGNFRRLAVQGLEAEERILKRLGHHIILE